MNINQKESSFTSIRWQEFLNISGEEIPPFACVKMTSAYDDATPLGDKPDGTGLSAIYLNGPLPVPIDARGTASQDWPLHGFYEEEDGIPQPSEIWGPSEDEWKLRKGSPGFYILGGPIDQRVFVTIHRPSKFKAILGEAPGPKYPWKEARAAADGKYNPLPGGLSGTVDLNPAWERNKIRGIRENTVVDMEEGYNPTGLPEDQEYVFDFEMEPFPAVIRVNTGGGTYLVDELNNDGSFSVKPNGRRDFAVAEYNDNPNVPIDAKVFCDHLNAKDDDDGRTYRFWYQELKIPVMPGPPPYNLGPGQSGWPPLFTDGPNNEIWIWNSYTNAWILPCICDVIYPYGSGSGHGSGKQWPSGSGASGSGMTNWLHTLCCPNLVPRTLCLLISEHSEVTPHINGATARLVYQGDGVWRGQDNSYCAVIWTVRCIGGTFTLEASCTLASGPGTLIEVTCEPFLIRYTGTFTDHGCCAFDAEMVVEIRACDDGGDLQKNNCCPAGTVIPDPLYITIQGCTHLGGSFPLMGTSANSWQSDPIPTNNGNFMKFLLECVGGSVWRFSIYCGTDTAATNYSYVINITPVNDQCDPLVFDVEGRMPAIAVCCGGGDIHFVIEGL